MNDKCQDASITSNSQPMIDALNESIAQLQEVAFLLMEQKERGETTVSMEDYECLLNWSLESLRGCRDHFE